MLEYRSVADLNRALLSKLELFRRHADLIVGIPRGGMLAALLLALHLDVPVTDLESYLEGRVLGGGYRLDHRQRVNAGNGSARRRVLILDDSHATGMQMKRARERVAASAVSSEDLVTYAAVFVTPGNKGRLDIWCEEVPNRIFEWNLFNHRLLAESCVDIDGVLCRDPTEAENDDGPMYLEFLSTVAPLRVPSREVGWLVTSRLEKYRSVTEEWLAKNGFRYRELVMLDLPSREMRVAAQAHSVFKSEVYARTKASLFIESDASQARDIAVKCRKPVFCVATGEMVYHDSVDKLVRRSRRAMTLRGRVRALVPAAARPLIRRVANSLGLRL